MRLRVILADQLGRVGSGPFPTEATGEWGEKLQTIGREVSPYFLEANFLIWTAKQC